MRWRLDELLSWQSCDSMKQTLGFQNFLAFWQSCAFFLPGTACSRCGMSGRLWVSTPRVTACSQYLPQHEVQRSVYVRCCPNFLELRYTQRKLVLGNWSPMRCVQLGYRLVSIWRPQSHSCVLCGGDGYGCVKMMCAVYANSIRSKDWAGMKGAQVHSAWCVQIAKPKSDLKFVRSHGPVKHLHPSWSWWRMWWVTRLQIVGRLISLFASNSVRARAEDCSQGLADHLYTRCKEYNKIYIVSWHIFAWELMGLRHLKWAAPFYLGRNTLKWILSGQLCCTRVHIFGDPWTQPVPVHEQEWKLHQTCQNALMFVQWLRLGRVLCRVGALSGVCWVLLEFLLEYCGRCIEEASPWAGRKVMRVICVGLAARWHHLWNAAVFRILNADSGYCLGCMIALSANQ